MAAAKGLQNVLNNLARDFGLDRSFLDNRHYGARNIGAALNIMSPGEISALVTSMLQARLGLPRQQLWPVTLPRQVMSAFSSKSEAPPLLQHVPGLLSGLAVTAVILGLLAYSALTVLGSGDRQVAASIGSTAPGTGVAAPLIDSIAPASPTLILCNGSTLVSAGSGPIYHIYILELLNEADSAVLTSGQASPNCVRTGLGSDDFR